MSIIEIFPIALFFICFYGLIVSRNIIKSIVFILLMEASIIMFFLTFGFGTGIVPPVGANLYMHEHVADPLPQALMITAIVVGLATTAINITMFITLFRKFKSADWDEVKELNKQDANLTQKEFDEKC